jgi:hypothetical protein
MAGSPQWWRLSPGSLPRGGGWVWVPDHLPRLDVAHGFARVQLPLYLN